MTSPRWKRRPHGSNWGEFGPDDRIGRLKSADAGAGSVQAMKEVRDGPQLLPVAAAGFSRRERSEPASLPAREIQFSMQRRRSREMGFPLMAKVKPGQTD